MSDSHIVGLLRSHLRKALRQARVDKHRIFLDLYAGEGGVACCISKLGFASCTFEIDLGNQFDLTRRVVHNLIVGWISSGVVSGLYLATQCSSWSRARRGPPGSNWCLIRNNQFIYGVPDLNISNQQKVDTGNTQMKNSAHLIRMCVVSGTPVMLENPVTSLMWSAPPVCALLRLKCCQSTTFDMCGFGTRWKKGTRIAAWNCVSLDSLSRKCSGRKGICSFSHKPHIVLSGSCAGSSKLWTSVAQAYPTRLCQSVARILVESARMNRYRLVIKAASGQ